MDLTPLGWIERCAEELCALWPALPPVDATGIARELWTQTDSEVAPERAAQEEIRAYRRLS